MMRRSADAVGVGQHPGVEHRHRLVVGAVQHQQRPGMQPGRGGRRPGSRAARATRRRSAGGNDAERMIPTSRACSSSRRGWLAQSSKSAGAPMAATPRTRASSAAAHTVSAPPGAEPGHPHPADVVDLVQVVAGRLQVVEPPRSEKSPSESPQPRKQTTSTDQPSSVAMRSASSGNDLADSRPPPRPLGNPWPMTRPGDPGARGAAGPGQVAPDADVPGRGRTAAPPAGAGRLVERCAWCPSRRPCRAGSRGCGPRPACRARRRGRPR